MATSLTQLPSELLGLVVCRLPAVARQSFSRTCRRFSQLVDAEGYLSLDTTQIQVDIAKQVLLIWNTAGEESGWIVCLNSKLEHSQSEDSRYRSRILVYVRTTKPFVVQYLGHNWLQSVGTYLRKLRQDFIVKELRVLKMILPDPLTPIPQELSTLKDIRTDHISMNHEDWNNYSVMLPPDVLPLICQCRVLTSSFCITLESLSALAAEEMFCHATDSEGIRIIQHYANGTLPMLSGACELTIIGNVHRCIDEARRQDSAAELWANVIQLPRKEQQNGKSYSLSISHSGVMYLV